MPEPFTTATGYVAAGGLGGGIGAASMLAFLKPKNAWAGLAQVCMGLTWGFFGGKSFTDMFSMLPFIGKVIDPTSYYQIAFCGAIVGCLVYSVVGALARYFIKLESENGNILDIAQDLKDKADSFMGAAKK